jgi:hypothetical protein
MLVCASIYQACKVFELLGKTDLAGRCAIVTSYQPSAADIKGEDSGEGMNEELRKYDVYRKMLAEFFEEPEDKAMVKVEDFEKKVKERFVKEPGQMRLLIVVDKLLTGFDALVRAYANLANELTAAGYTAEEAVRSKAEVEHYAKVREEVSLAAGDTLDMKQYEPAMRRLLETSVNTSSHRITVSGLDVEVVRSAPSEGWSNLLRETRTWFEDHYPKS